MICGPCGREERLLNSGLCVDCELDFRLNKVQRMMFEQSLIWAAKRAGLSSRSRRLEATTGPGLRQRFIESGAHVHEDNPYPDTGESGETYDAEMASLNNRKPRTKA